MIPVIVKIVGVKKKNYFLSYVLLVLCTETAIAQFAGGPTQIFPNQLNSARLSPQQQGHILSDIQQHQHRFNVQPNIQFSAQQTNTLGNGQQIFQNQQLFNQQFLQNQQQQVHNIAPSSIPQHQQPVQSNAIFNQHVSLPNQPTSAQFNAQSLPNQPASAQFNAQSLQNQPSSAQFNAQSLPNQPAPPQFNVPTVQSNFNSLPANSQQSNQQVLQHHTQTSFTPNLSQQLPKHNSNNPIFQATSAPDTFPLEQPLNLTPEQEKQRVKELQEKQAIIEKHNQYIKKQYDAALKKAQSDHIDFVKSQQNLRKKLYTRLYKTTSGLQSVRYSLNNPRYIYPEEISLFNLAVKKYYEEHPTTTTTTTTTEAPTTTEKEESFQTLELETSQQNLFNQLKLQNSQKGNSDRVTKKLPFLPTAIPAEEKFKPIQSLDDLSNLQTQYKNHKINKDDLLAQLRLAIGENPDEDFSNKNISSREISLPNGQKVQIIKTTDPNLIKGATPLGGQNSLEQLFISTTTTTAKPTKEYIQELTQGVLPKGADFELIKPNANGGFEHLSGIPSNLPDQKKVTFVLLEEQDDGSFKVQGVKGNEDKYKNEKELESVLKKIKQGEIKLPSPPKKTPSSISPPLSPVLPTKSTPRIKSTTSTPTTKRFFSTNSVPTDVTVLPNSVASSDKVTKTFRLSTNFGVSPSSKTPKIISSSNSNQKVRFNLNSRQSNDLLKQASTATTANQNSIYKTSFGSTYKPNVVSTTPSYISRSTNPTASTLTQSYRSTTASDEAASTSSIFSIPPGQRSELPEVLKKNGLYAMAKFLRQSGLDTILNETGPYTVFAPTDKAFRTLLVQLGGPERAEEKFKENPRLLSGLLLHHVIPGSFTIDSLQDEMTGVSLAGTQLRVNQYKMHDVEWNDIKVTTINGAKVVDDKKDIEIPQGTAHSVDRVMFPLPVGDIIQTLQADRERRFTNFLRALFTSGLAESLQGTKTFTLFAPTDKAFLILSPEDLTKSVTDSTLARELIMRHLIPGTLYTTGMRYYQVRDSLEPERQITLSKSSGKVKVNNAQIATPNIPATNGVIHALDVLL